MLERLLLVYKHVLNVAKNRECLRIFNVSVINLSDRVELMQQDSSMSDTLEANKFHDDIDDLHLFIIVRTIKIILLNGKTSI